MSEGYLPRRLRRLLLVSLALTAIACGGRQEDADRLANLMHVEPGQSVADVGAGSGEMAVMMAEKVGPTGHVFATEIDPERLEEISKRARSAGLKNLTVVAGTQTDTRLSSECCDAIYMRHVYHHLVDPEAIDASLYRALKPGGELAILDFRPNRSLGGQGFLGYV